MDLGIGIGLQFTVGWFNSEPSPAPEFYSYIFNEDGTERFCDDEGNPFVIL